MTNWGVGIQWHMRGAPQNYSLLALWIAPLCQVEGICDRQSRSTTQLLWLCMACQVGLRCPQKACCIFIELFPCADVEWLLHLILQCASAEKDSDYQNLFTVQISSGASNKVFPPGDSLLLLCWKQD